MSRTSRKTGMSGTATGRAKESASATEPELVALRKGMTTRSAALRRSEENTSELQSLMRNSYAVFSLKKKKNQLHTTSPKSTNRREHKQAQYTTRLNIHKKRYGTDHNT